MNRLKKEKYLSFLVAISMIGFCVSDALAVTAQDIVDSVIDNLDNVNDYQASVDIDHDNVSLNDMTGGSFKWKRNSGSWKIKMVMGTPYSGNITSDGSAWNVTNKDDDLMWFSLSEGKNGVRDYYGSDMFNMENILDDETWTKAGSTETVNSVECYKIYTTNGSSNYEVWVDTATMDKVIRVKATCESDDLQWQLDYSDYSDVEGTAQLPATIVVKYYRDETLYLTSTYDFSSIDINANLSGSLFTIEYPD